MPMQPGPSPHKPLTTQLFLQSKQIFKVLSMPMQPGPSPHKPTRQLFLQSKQIFKVLSTSMPPGPGPHKPTRQLFLQSKQIFMVLSMPMQLGPDPLSNPWVGQLVSDLVFYALGWRQQTCPAWVLELSHTYNISNELSIQRTVWMDNSLFTPSQPCRS